MLEVCDCEICHVVVAPGAPKNEVKYVEKNGLRFRIHARCLRRAEKLGYTEAVSGPVLRVPLYPDHGSLAVSPA